MFGVPELLIVLAIVLLILGPKRLPALGRALGAGIRDLKDSLARRHDEPTPVDEPEPVDGEVVADRRR